MSFLNKDIRIVYEIDDKTGEVFDNKGNTRLKSAEKAERIRLMLIREEEDARRRSEEEKTLSSYSFKVYHVYSGLDAFSIPTKEGKVYSQYISVIARNQEEARKNAALICGQRIEDNDTNDSYENSVYYAEYIRLYSDDGAI
jgi:hypothetical protein